MSNILQINCHILGQCYIQGFRVEINRAAAARKLKGIIKEKRKNLFQHVDADSISLWKVSILRGPNLPTDLSQITNKTELDNLGCLSNYFSEELADQYFHVLVKPPTARVGSLPPLGDSTAHQGAHSLLPADATAYGAAPAQKHEIKHANPPGDDAPYHTPKPLRLELLAGSKTIYKTDFEVEIDDDTIIFPSNSDFERLISTPNLVAADKTKYIEMLDKAPEYQYIFLRPRRWGKSTFLQTLANYYNKNNVNSFNDQFGQLYIGKHPTRFRNSYLVLLFDFSSISTRSEELMAKSFRRVINTTLREFLTANANFLKNANKKELIKEDASESLSLVLNFVRANRERLFVGIDEYDAPANSCLFSEDGVQFVDVADLFKTQFYAIVKQAMGRVIHKYWLTGVLPAFRDGISPLSSTTLISMSSEYHGLCGLTEDEVHTIAQVYLGPMELDMKMREIKQWYNGHKFYNGPAERLSLSEEASAVHSTVVLDAIGYTKAIAFQDLFLLLLSGKFKAHVATEFGAAEVKHFGRDPNMTGTLLYYFGVFTFGQNGMLGIPNATMRFLVTRRFRNFLKYQAGIEDSLNHAQDALGSGNLHPLVSFVESFLQTRPVRSVKSLSEETFQAVIETIYVGTDQCIPELCLVIDPNASYGSGRFAFVNLFAPTSSPILVIELKSISLINLWTAMDASKRDNPTESDLFKLRGMLKAESEEELLHRKFRYYDKKLGRQREQSVADIRQAAANQAARYLKVISGGNATSGSGLCDRRIHCDEGDDRLIAHVIICIGGTRLLTWPVTAIHPTAYKFRLND